MVRAAVLYEPRQPMELVELRQAGPQANEVKLRIRAAGICASDHHIMLGQTNFPLPMVLGHEGAGVVEEVGSEVTAIKPGDRCVLSFVPFCGHCKACRAGRSQMCLTHRATGGKMLDGTFRLQDEGGRDVYQFGKLGVFAESVIVPMQACFPIPEHVSLEEAALVGCGVATGVASVVHQPGIGPGSSVAVFGAGGVGLNALQGARLVSAAPVVAVDIHDHKLEFAKRFGATHVVNSAKQDAAEEIKRITGGGAEYAFDTFGHSATTEQMMACLAPAGRGVLVGLAPEGMEAKVNMVDLTRNEKVLAGSYYGSANPHETFEMLFGLMRDDRIDVKGLLEREYALEQVNEAYDDLAAGKNGRGLIKFGE